MIDDVFPWLSRRTTEIPRTDRDRVVADQLALAVVQFYERTGKYPTHIAMRPGTLSVEAYDICGIRIIWNSAMPEGDAALFMFEGPPRVPVEGDGLPKPLFGRLKL